jgi:Arabinose-binding domain of AraC transcription regulator, N-term
MSRDHHWFHIAPFTGLDGFLAERGIAPADLLQRCQISPATFIDPDSRIPRALALRMINEVPRITGDPFAPLRVVNRQTWSDYGAGGRSVLQAETLADAVAAFARVAHLTQSGTRIDLDTTSANARLSITSIGTSTEDTALHLLTGVQWLYRTVGLAGDQAPIEVRLGQPASRLTSDYEGFLGANLAFGGDRYEVVFDRGLLDLPVIGRLANGSSGRRHKLATDRLDDLRAVHLMVADALPRIRPTVERVAAKFGIPECHRVPIKDNIILRRHLAACGLLLTHERGCSLRLGVSEAHGSVWVGCSWDFVAKWDFSR